MERRIEDDICGKLGRQRRLDEQRKFRADESDVEDARREIHRPAEQPGEGQYRHMLGRVGRIAPGVELLPARALAADPVRPGAAQPRVLDRLVRVDGDMILRNRKSVVWGKSVSIRVVSVGSSVIKKKKKTNNTK